MPLNYLRLQKSANPPPYGRFRLFPHITAVQ